MYIITKLKFEGAGYAAMTSLVLNLYSGRKYYWSCDLVWWAEKVFIRLLVVWGINL